MKKFRLIMWAVGGIMLGALFVRMQGEMAWAEGDLATGVPGIYIKAVNPGYGTKNVGEMIEIGRRENGSDAEILLAGIKISYTNSSGNKSTLMEFPEQSYMTGETILLRLASSPENELAAATYTKTLALKGGLEIWWGEELVDSVCWTGKDGCYKDFKSASPTTLVRRDEEFVHEVEYAPDYDAQAYRVETVNDEQEVVMPQCTGVKFSEILSYYAETQDEQFIELYNAGAEQALLNGCVLRYKNKTYPLEGVVTAEGYLVRYLTDFSVTKNPTNVGTVELVDVTGVVVDKLEYPNGQRKGTSYAWIGYDEAGEELWRTTYAVTPGEANNYQEYKTCEEGKVINEATGNCVKITEVAVKTCADGQFLNPLTGRCKKIEEVGETTCKEGYELNPETGRCKKIKDNNGADYALVTETYEEESGFVALYAVLGVAVAGLGYVIYEFRREILRLWRRVFRRFH